MKHFLLLITLFFTLAGYAQLNAEAVYKTDVDLVDLLENPEDTIKVTQTDTLPHVLQVDFAFKKRGIIKGVLSQNRPLGKRKVELTVQVTDENYSTNTYTVKVKTNEPYLLDLSKYLSPGLSANVRIYCPGFNNVLSSVYMDKGKLSE